jgi:hypothetical protein
MVPVISQRPAERGGSAPPPLKLPPPGDEIKEEHNDRDHQKQVDQTSANMSDKTEQPKNDQNDDDSVEHDNFS